MYCEKTSVSNRPETNKLKLFIVKISGFDDFTIFYIKSEISQQYL